jgi:hypothetical protein
MINRKKVKDIAVDNTAGESSKDFEIKIKVKIGEKTIEEDLEDALYIPTADRLNPTVVSDMMAENPSMHARWNYLYNEAVFAYDIMKTKLEVWLSKKGQENRKELAKLETGRITEKQIDDTIKLDPEYEKMNEDLAEAKKNMKHILALANGLGEKGDKIISIASLLKWEGEGLRKTGPEKGYNHIGRPKDKDSEKYKFDGSNGGWPAQEN